MEKHFKLTDNTKTLPDGTVLHQIECTRDCKWAMKGELGGWIEKEGNLSDNAWVSGDARVYGDAWVYGGALIENSRDYCCFQSFGSRNDTTTAFRQKDGSILISCGCFSGSLFWLMTWCITGRLRKTGRIISRLRKIWWNCWKTSWATGIS